MTKMVGKINKPFCGNCCSAFPPGSGKAHKRVGTKVQKSREKRELDELTVDDWTELTQQHLAGESVT